MRRLALLASLLTAACGPLVQIGGGSAPPAALYTLQSTVPPRQVPPRLGVTLLLEAPTVPQVLNTARIPVVTGDTELAYLVGARWVEQPANLLQPLLADVIASRTGVPVTNPSNYDVLTDYRLSGELRAFGLDVRDPAQAVVSARYDAILSRTGGGLLDVRRFEVSEPARSQSPADVAYALNAAANRLAVEVADWTAARIGSASAAPARPTRAPPAPPAR